MDFIYIIRVILNRLPIIIAVSFTAALITGLLTYLSPKKYQSDALLSTGYTVSRNFALAEERFSLVEADLKFNNLIEEINSVIVIGTLSHHLLLHDLTMENTFHDFEKEDSKGLNEALNGVPKDTVIKILQDKIVSFELLSSYDSLERKIAATILDLHYSPIDIRKTLRIERANYTDYISVKCETEDPFLSAFIVNTLCDEFLRYNRMIKHSQSSESVEFLTSLAEQKQELLETKSNNLRAYKARNQFLNFELESESKISQSKETEEKRNDALNAINRINVSIGAIDARITNSKLENPISTNEFGRLRKRLTALNEKRRNGKGDYATLTDSIFIIRNQLDNLLEESSPLNKDLLNERESLNIELQIEEEKLADIEARLSRIQREVSSFVSTEATISFLQREVDIAAEEYLKVQEKLNEVRNARFNSKDAIKIVLRGQPAMEHQSSGLLMKAAISFMASFVVCLSIILGIEFINPRIKIVSRFNNMVDMKLLGSIIHQAPRRKFLGMAFGKKRTLKNTSSSLRKLRNKITSQNGRIILWTSLSKGDGKSSTLYAVANSLGLMDKKVLIIDTNFRSNKFFIELSENKTKKIEVTNNLLNENQASNDSQSSKEEKVQIFDKDLAASIDNENVHIITNKGPEGSPAEILSGMDLNQTLNHLIENNIYDYIFMEGATLNNHSDAIELATYVHQVIVVFDALKGIDQTDLTTLKFVNGFDGKLMGAVLNKELSLKEV